MVHKVQLFHNDILLEEAEFASIEHRNYFAERAGSGWFAYGSGELKTNRVIVDGEEWIHHKSSITKRIYADMVLLQPFMQTFHYDSEDHGVLYGVKGFHKYVSLFRPGELWHAGSMEIEGERYYVSFYKFSSDFLKGGYMFFVSSPTKDTEFIIRVNHSWQDLCQMNYLRSEKGGMLKDEHGNWVANGVYGSF
jgi:hypothetical protein